MKSVDKIVFESLNLLTVNKLNNVFVHFCRLKNVRNNKSTLKNIVGADLGFE